MKFKMKFSDVIATLTLFLVLLILPGCNNGADIRVDNDDWGPCVDYSFLDQSAQCKTSVVPLDYDVPQGRLINISTFRYSGSGTNCQGQIWFLEGGPGGSGRLLARAMLQLAKYYPDFDFYSLDHRGVGGSTRFGCEGDNDFGDDWDKYQSCYNELEQTWGDDLLQFSTTNAARDLHNVISLNREPGKKVFIWATSYGTYWLLRYLQLYPQEVDGVIIDSICTPGHCYLDRYDGWNDMVGKQFLDLCQADPTCQEKMSTMAADPAQAVELVFDKIDQGSLPPACQNLFTRKELRATLAQMVINWSTRILVPPLIYRLNRCNAADQEVLSFYKQASQAGATDRSILNSPMLCDLISLSELYGGNTSSELEAFLQDAFFSEDVSLRFAEIYESGLWQLYSDPIHEQQLPQTNIPMLMINGTTDPQTPLEIAEKMKNHFTGPFQHFVTVPYSTHGVLVNSPITIPPWTYGGQEQTCGSLLFGQFINDPYGVLDTSCLQTVYPVDFDSTTENNRLTSEKSFGTDDMWEGEVASPSTPQP